MLRHSQDEALCTWALHEHVLIVEEVEQLQRRIEWKEKEIKEKRACKEEEEEKELQEMTCNVQVHVSNYRISVCIQHSYILSKQDSNLIGMRNLQFEFQLDSHHYCLL